MSNRQDLCRYPSPRKRKNGPMLVVRATKKLLDRVGPPDLEDGEQSDTLLGQWYATALFWRPQVALFVNEPTLLPVLVPLAPAATLLARFPEHVAAVLAERSAPKTIIDNESRRMGERRIAKTDNRSVTGVVTEFARLAEFYRRDGQELPELAARLARVPCSPLYKRHVSPDREFDALLRSITPADD